MPSKNDSVQAVAYHDRTYTKALVRNGDKIKTVFYYSLKGHVYVKDGETDITIIEASTGQSLMSSKDKLDFIANDPDLTKNGRGWTCGGCTTTKYCNFTRQSVLQSWLQHKVRCWYIQRKLWKELNNKTNKNKSNKDLVPSDLVIRAKTNRSAVFVEDETGVFREVFDDGDCIAVEAERAAAKKNKLFDHPLLVIP